MKAGRFGSYLRLIAGVSAIVLLFTGCAPVSAGGGGTYTYLSRELSQDLDRPVIKVYAATMDALKDFHLPVTRDVHDSLSAMIESRFSDGRKILIKIDSESAYDSEISVRVGLLGDKDMSGTILGAIDDHLELSVWDKTRIRVMANSWWMPRYKILTSRPPRIKLPVAPSVKPQASS